MNRRYIAMLKHDLVLGRKTLILTGVAWLVCLIITILVFLSAKYGNLAKVTNKDELMLTIRVTMLSFSVLVSVMWFVNYNDKVFLSDMKCGWQKFRYTTPLTVREQLNYRYGAKVIGLLLSLIPSAVEAGVIVLLNGQGLNKMEWIMMLCMISYGYITSVVMLPLTALFKDNDKAGISSLVVLIVILLPAFIKGRDIGDKLDAMAKAKGGVLSVNDMIDMLSGYLPYVAVGIPVIMAAVTAVSYICMKKLLEKRVC
ncbi:MAG: hypothetical protein E7493_12055 [Ruminococcus albus]|nr:hypothetical protein [Ruminococcus albus]